MIDMLKEKIAEATKEYKKAEEKLQQKKDHLFLLHIELKKIEKDEASFKGDL